MKYFFVLLFFITACDLAHEKGSRFGNISYKYLALGEGDHAKNGQYLQVNLMVCSTKGDTLHYVPSFPYFIKVGNKSLDSALMMMLPGDSMHFTCSKSLINNKFRFYSLLADSIGDAELRVGLKQIIEVDEKEITQKKALSLREIKEQEALMSYLNSTKSDFEQFHGVYRKVLSHSEGIPLSFGDIVELDYKGYFLNGYVFDDTKKKGSSPRFVFGEELQLIDGIQYGLIGAKEGESLKIIVPSRRGFGEEGSIAGIVPPYTTVIFDIHIKKVIKQR